MTICYNSLYMSQSMERIERKSKTAYPILIFTQII